MYDSIEAICYLHFILQASGLKSHVQIQNTHKFIDIKHNIDELQIVTTSYSTILMKRATQPVS